MTRPPLPIRRALLAAVLVAAAACGRAEGGGRRERVVAVSKQINEYLYAIGAQDLLVGRDLTSLYPAEIRRLPSVGYHRALSAEGIVSLQPTLLLTDGNVGPDAVLDQVRKVGVPVETMKPGSTMDSAQLLLARLGARFHRERAADSVLAAWRNALASAVRESRPVAGEPRPRVLVMHFGQLVNDYLAVNRGGAADQLIAWAGGVNAVDSVGGMTRLTPELIAKAAPDVIIATDVGFDRLGSAERFAALPGVSLTPAGKAGRIHRIDESEIMYFGPRTPAALVELSRALHPSRGPERGPPATTAARP
ncbi:MAG: hemin ABC transporter substrate-binding protein [Gemmatimonadaceae bacterium]